MGNLALFHPELNGVITLLTTASRGPPLKIKTPPEVGTIDSSSEGSWLQGGMEQNEVSKFLCRAQNGESSKLFQSIPSNFCGSTWVVVPCTILLSFFFMDLHLAFSLRVVNCSRNPLVLKGKFDFENGLTSSWRITSLLLNRMYNYRLVYISCSCVYFTPQYLGVNLFLYYFYIFICLCIFLIFLAIHYIYMFMYVQIMAFLLGICRRQWGARSKQKQLFQCFFSRMQPSSISRMLMGAEPSYCHVDWVHGFHAFFQVGTLQSGPKNATNYRN